MLKKMEEPKHLLKMEHVTITKKLSEPWYFTHAQKVRGRQTMQKQIIQRYSGSKRDELIRKYFGNKTRCVICENNIF